MVKEFFSLSVEEIVAPHRKVFLRTFYVGAAAIIGFALWRTNQPYVSVLGPSLLLLMLGLVPSYLWVRGLSCGLPLIPAIALVDIPWFAIPFLTAREEFQYYTEDQLARAAWTQVLFMVAMIVPWVAITRGRAPRPRRLLWLGETQHGHWRRWIQACLGLFFLITVYRMMQTSGLGNVIYLIISPRLRNVVETFLLTSTFAVVFLLSLAWGMKVLRGGQLGAFLTLSVLLNAANIAQIFLNPLIPFLGAATAGYTLGRGRIPWALVLGVVLIANFLNVGKTQMRRAYWSPDATFMQEYLLPHRYPEFFLEWSDYSLQGILNPESIAEDARGEDLASRMSMVEILLRAQSMAPELVPYMGGETYELVPLMMIPRIIWPDKPRTHEGQARLNVHFGMQTLEQTYITYIAWGCTAEAYGNFGMVGVALIGLAIGAGFAYLSRWTSNVPLGSLRVLLGLVFLMQGIRVTQVSAGVWVASVFQSVLLVTALCYFFLKPRRTPVSSVPTRPLQRMGPPGLFGPAVAQMSAARPVAAAATAPVSASTNGALPVVAGTRAVKEP